ncbi:transglutaminase family protein [Nigerium massiliense]|uniref:transglutaminase family protein n=1 Tax=Nigerium massiliense TaxID=1522317 RepID=UPI00058C6B6E|nr:transglutaminase family protein [Nigerium massiliense]
MTIRVALQHRTTYTFAEPVRVYPHEVRLRPAPHTRTPISAYSLTVHPRDHFLNWQQDPFGNYLARLVFPNPVSELDITVDLIADMTVINPFDFFVEEYAETFPFSYPDAMARDLAPYLRPIEASRLDDWIERTIHVPDEGMRIVDFLVMVNQAVTGDVAYSVRMEAGVQDPDTTLDRGIGSCRDSGWLLVAVLRRLGLAARFVSGYLIQLAADVAPLEGPSGPAEDFTDLHAWAEVFVPGAGWIGLDATSGLFAGEGHIPLSATPDPASSAAISGATAPVDVTMSFSNTVRRIHEDPRVTKPYTDEQWSAADALGQHVDGLLRAGDVRLTMGGEPTFVSADDTSSPQWQGAADGPEKRALAHDLATRLFDRWAPGGLIHHGQGKWYPGEPLPRWQLTMTWRADGVPIWEDPDLADDPWRDPVVPAGSAEARIAARDLALYIAAKMGIPQTFVLPAYEDVLNDALQEALAPEGDERPAFDPDPGEDTPEGRRAIVDRFDADRTDPAGWVVPIFRTEDGERWGTSQWRTRRRHLYLTPGTSPVGLRLPLASLAWDGPPYEPERSPFEELGPLPEISGEAAEPADVLDVAEAPHHALCVEEREGHLFVFLPPLTHLEDALDLVAAVEASASAIELPVVLEGYPLPFDLRVKTLSVTPDPGVIEVNTQPTSSWVEQRDLTLSLYEDARRSRLGTEKFDVDGTHTGTGGGNHFTLGGATPADSPLLRRPDLLRSLITYWQHHPSLSYVFSGRFVGPTSQAPRVDEGRADTLYELEIAFSELDRLGEDVSPWQVDRLLRHLLTDLTGNTHRAEFCIDKLYSPDSQRGRLGLLEMRAFEMPPHSRMALVQTLLVRTLVARFWAEPYAHDLVRWGTRLHDRFLLPEYARLDLDGVIDEVNAFLATSTDLRFDKAWLDPFFEFRFPRLGERDIAGAHLELRQAIEPWNVLGEEATSSGTARYVDSSVERVQVMATGLVEGRHRVTCNGVPVPLHTIRTGTQVAGVRYRAWAPPSSLHPTMGVHSPLTFDVVDTWNGRSLGGFTYHVVHPGGRSYDTTPVNAVEAESRRESRFEELGLTGGFVDTSTWPETTFTGEAEFPVTLDLRRHTPGSVAERDG